MRKCFCDGCEKEIKSINSVDVPNHITQGSNLLSRYEDTEGNATSGRTIRYDLCNSCLNIFYGAAYKALINIKECTN